MTVPLSLKEVTFTATTGKHTALTAQMRICTECLTPTNTLTRGRCTTCADGEETHKEHREEHRAYRAMLQHQAKLKEVPPMSNFIEHTVYMTADQEATIRSGEMRRKEALALLSEGLLPEIILSAGDVVEFAGNNQYAIVRIEGDDMIVRRLTANRAGPAGEVHQAPLSDYVKQIRNGECFVVQDEA